DCSRLTVGHESGAQAEQQEKCGTFCSLIGEELVRNSHP
ncbi:uncharacterized, partial [Tachysurus ichikawai]